MTIKFGITISTHLQQEAPLTLRGQRGRFGNIKREPPNIWELP